MQPTPQIDPTSTVSLLASLGLAIDEAKLIKAIKISKNMIRQLEAENPSSERLPFLMRDLSKLEAKLEKIRRNADRAIIVSRTAIR